MSFYLRLPTYCTNYLHEATYVLLSTTIYTLTLLVKHKLRMYGFGVIDSKNAWNEPCSIFYATPPIPFQIAPILLSPRP